MAEVEKRNKEIEKKDIRDNPEGSPTDTESLLDRFESEQTVDPIPVEELKISVEDEKNKEKTKNSSSSEKRYPG
ncbi:hypothetical protein [Paenibacillus agricola]|uniref:YfhD-like protein n=1 Tax=Paenibacillus agricola TaxID=2716264 RepID=A0ABX0J4W1_9BACL|nr:hypothetical protein [Paenibacillus agricola]NHN30861.1 hypothetical protein [Paenibacillus agricola]